MIEIIGQKFGKLTVKEFLGYRIYSNNPNRKYPLFFCKCDCGKHTTVTYGHLKNDTKSCGCLKKENHYSLEKNESTLNNIIYDYKRKANKKRYSFELTRENFKDLFNQKCFYCGKEPSNNRHNYKYNGIDRIDNTKGYSLDNCVPCCKNCNTAKGTMSIKEFQEWNKDIFERFMSMDKIRPFLG